VIGFRCGRIEDGLVRSVRFRPEAQSSFSQVSGILCLRSHGMTHGAPHGVAGAGGAGGISARGSDDHPSKPKPGLPGTPTDAAKTAQQDPSTTLGISPVGSRSAIASLTPP